MALVESGRFILIDCAGNAVVRIEEAGLNILDLSDLILTHYHPDHISGVPLLLMDSWLLGRKKPLNIHGLTYTLDKVKNQMENFGWDDWPNFFPVHFHALPEQEMTPVIADDDWNIFASPVRHMIPNIGLRIEFKESKKVIAYSCDTAPCQEVIRLAKHAEVLIHEASGDFSGHSSAYQAGEIASTAEVKQLYLIHYDSRTKNPQSLKIEAQSAFNTNVSLAEDLGVINF